MVKSFAWETSMLLRKILDMKAFLNDFSLESLIQHPTCLKSSLIHHILISF